MGIEESPLIPRRSKFEEQLAHLHFKGLAGVDLLEIPAVTGHPKVQARLTSSTSAAVRKAIGEAFSSAALHLADVDRRLVPILFGVGDTYGWGVRRRHTKASELTKLAWTHYRHEPFSGLCRRLTAALENRDPVTTGGSQPLPGIGFRLARLEQEYVVPTVADAAATLMERRRIVSEMDGLSEWSMPTKFLSDSMTATPTAVLIGSGTLTFDPIPLRDQAGAGYEADMVVTFPRPLQKGEEFDFKILRRLPVDIERYRQTQGPYYTGYGLTPVTDVLRITVQLDAEHLPTRVVRQNGVMNASRFSFTAPESETLVTDGISVITSEWRTPQVRRWFGLIWD